MIRTSDEGGPLGSGEMMMRCEDDDDDERSEGGGVAALSDRVLVPLLETSSAETVLLAARSLTSTFHN
jgi:hypothetical protein